MRTYRYASNQYNSRQLVDGYYLYYIYTINMLFIKCILNSLTKFPTFVLKFYFFNILKIFCVIEYAIDKLIAINKKNMNCIEIFIKHSMFLLSIIICMELRVYLICYINLFIKFISIQNKLY